jgi:drug/metabolite transporter (DMT)-like permease
VNGRLALAAGLVTVTLWGSAYVGIRAAGLSPGPLALGRLLVGLAFAGCLLIGLSGSRSGSLGGVAWLVVAAVAYASAVVIQKPVLARVSPLSVTWYGCACATVVCLPFGPGLVRELGSAGVDAVGWTVYLGLGPTALGFATWAHALRHSTAGRLAALAYLIPVVAIVLGWVVLGQAPPGLALAGGALCLVGVMVARRPAAAAAPPK